MAGTARRVRRYYGNEYVDGSAARVIREVPDRQDRYAREREERRTREDRVRRYNRAVRQNQKHALRMDLPYLVMLTLATVAALFICCHYIRVQSSIAASMRAIEAQEKLLETMRSENDALQNTINTNIDLDHIYEVATKELGMVYAGRNQVIHYRKTESEYVRQYEDIPGEPGR